MGVEDGEPVATVAGFGILASDGLDMEALAARLAARREKVLDEVGKTEKKLSNERFVDNAPEEVVAEAREKLERKGVPLIVANLGPATFGRDDNSLLLVDAAGERELPRADKLSLARQLVAEIAARLPPAQARASAA